MRISIAAVFMILTTFFLSGCGAEQTASVEDRGGNYYGRNGTIALSSAGSYNTAPTQQAVIETHDTTPATAAPKVATQATGSTWQWPVHGKVTETFGQKSGGIANEGVVIAAAEGTPIKAAQAGEVAFVGTQSKIYGNIVILRHADGQMTSYSHAKDILVKKGDKVSAGSVIAHVGQSGNAKQPQLHFAVRQGHDSIDPLSKLPHQLASN